MQVHLHYILVQWNQKMWLLMTGDPLIEVTTSAGSTVQPSSNKKKSLAFFPKIIIYINYLKESYLTAVHEVALHIGVHS